MAFTEMRRLVGRMVLWVLLMLMLPLAFSRPAGATSQTAGKELATPFVLTVRDSRLSLMAREASLKAIVEAIGERLQIAVRTYLDQEPRVTLTFEDLALEEALARLRAYANIVYISEASTPGARVKTIVVLPRSPGASPAVKNSRSINAQPRHKESFKFEFDPSQFRRQQQ